MSISSTAQKKRNKKLSLHEPPEKPRKPTLRQIVLDDTTTEATAKVLADNPRGIAIVKDELIGFVRGMNQYKGGKGADREFWLSAWAGAPAKVNRSKDHDAGPLVIPHPFAAIAGMMCPDALPELRGDGRNSDAQGDGFLDRFLLSFPDPMDAAAETWRVVPEELEQGYCDVFLDLLGMEMVPEADGPKVTRHRPYFVRFAPDGRTAWEEFTGNMAVRMNALDKFDPFRGVLSKLRGTGHQMRAKAKYLMNSSLDMPLVISWKNVPVIASSYADEFIGKLFVELGPVAFNARVHLVDMAPVVQDLINRAIMQRIAQTMNGN